MSASKHSLLWRRGARGEGEAVAKGSFLLPPPSPCAPPLPPGSNAPIRLAGASHQPVWCAASRDMDGQGLAAGAIAHQLALEDSAGCGCPAPAEAGDVGLESTLPGMLAPSAALMHTRSSWEESPLLPALPIHPQHPPFLHAE
eukprot:1137628-Pelagomonas_calceolata.AAC.2